MTKNQQKLLLFSLTTQIIITKSFRLFRTKNYKIYARLIDNTISCISGFSQQKKSEEEKKINLKNGKKLFSIRNHEKIHLTIKTTIVGHELLLWMQFRTVTTRCQELTRHTSVPNWRIVSLAHDANFEIRLNHGIASNVRLFPERWNRFLNACHPRIVFFINYFY